MSTRKQRARAEINSGMAGSALPNPYEAGMNEFLLATGWTDAQIKKAVGKYGDQDLQSAARITYDAMVLNGADAKTCLDFIDPIRKFGFEAVRYLVKETGRTPYEILANYGNIKQNGFKVVLHKNVVPGLETKILGFTSQGQSPAEGYGTIVLDYAGPKK